MRKYLQSKINMRKNASSLEYILITLLQQNN